MAKSASTDRSYLELKNGKWRVTVAVPRALQDNLGTRLKRSLGTDSLAIANRLKWTVVAELKAEMDRATGGHSEPFLREALDVARLRRESPPGDHFDIDAAISERAEEIAGEPIGAELDPQAGEVPVYDPVRDERAKHYLEVASGTAIPVDLHHPDYLKQISASLTRRTVADDERAVRYLRQWCKTKGVPFMLHQMTRRVVSQFMDGLGEVSGAPSTVTHQKYLTRLSRYWKWMLDRDIAQANPWAGLRPNSKPTPYNEKERPFTDAEVARLLAGPATPAMHDLMRMAALSGARLDTIVGLKVRDCGEGVFVFKPQKKEQGPRRVPIHSTLLAAVAERSAGRGPEDPLFPEWPAPADPKSNRERSFKASNAFTTYRRTVGVDDVVPGKRRSLVNFHSFRRWFITKAEQAGQPESIIASVVGHTRPGITLGRYSAGPQVEQLRVCVEAVQLPEDSHAPYKSRSIASSTASRSNSKINTKGKNNTTAAIER